MEEDFTAEGDIPGNAASEAIGSVGEAAGVGEKPMEAPKSGKGKRMPGSAYIGIAIAIIAVAVLVLLSTSVLAPSTVAAGDNVSVYYTGSFVNGTVFSSNVGGTPLNFTAGSTQLIQGFSEAVIGMHVGENKTVTLPPSKAYGQVNDSLIISIPTSKFSNVSGVAVGEIVTSSVNGAKISGIVLAKNASDVVVDLNPPLAGKTLVFTIKLVRILSK